MFSRGRVAQPAEARSPNDAKTLNPGIVTPQIRLMRTQPASTARPRTPVQTPGAWTQFTSAPPTFWPCCSHPWCIDASSSVPGDVLVLPALAPNTMTETFFFAPRSPMNYSPDR